MGYINIDGKITTTAQANLAPDNRAFRYGYGLFETLLFVNGVIQLKELHFKRLTRSMLQLGMSLPTHHDIAWIEDNIAKTVKRNSLWHCCRVRLQLYSGTGGLYGKQTKTGIVIECFPIPDATLEFNEHGLVLGMATGLSKSPDALANLKTANALIYAMAARQAMANKWNDALIINTNNHVIESTIANFFWVKDDVLYTPPLQDGCIAGVMRQHIMESLANLQIPVIEQSCTYETLLAADELFLTNAIKKIKWVELLGEKTYSGKHTRYIWQKLFGV